MRAALLYSLIALAIAALVGACLIYYPRVGKEAEVVSFTNVDVYLPRPPRLPPWRIREIPEYWFRGDTDHLVVGTQRFVLRLGKGLTLWCVRIPSDVKDHWLPRVRVCPGQENRIWAVQWTPSTQESQTFERGVMVCAIGEDKGNLLAKLKYEIPTNITTDILAAIPWKGGCLVLFGHSGHNYAKVEHAVLFTAADDRIIVAAPEDIPEVIGWNFIGSRVEAQGGSTVLAKPSPEGGTIFKVVRSGDLHGRTISTSMSFENEFVPSGLDVPSLDLLLVRARAQQQLETVAYDLQTGGVKWRTVNPPGLLGPWWRGTLDKDRLFGVGSVAESGGVVCMLDMGRGKLTPLFFESRKSGYDEVCCAGEGPMVFSRGDDIYFATQVHTEGDKETVHEVYRISPADRAPKLVERLHLPADDDERPLLGGLIFLLPAGNGYWLGSGAGVIAYREYGNAEKPTKIQLPWN